MECLELGDLELLAVLVEAGRAAELLLPLAGLADAHPDVVRWLAQCAERGTLASFAGIAH